MITLDTSGLFAIFNDRDKNHEVMLAARDSDAGPYIVPAGILAEIAWMAEHTLGLGVLDAFLLDLERGSYTFDCGDNDWARMRQLTHRYADLRLGLADAAVIACAERNGGRVLTTDHRHFPVVARGEKSISIVPETLL